MPGAPETTGNHPKSLWPGVKVWFGVGYGQEPEEYRQLFDVMTSTQAWEEDVEQHGYGLAQVKRENTPTTFVGRAQGPVSRYTHVAYSLGFIVTYEELKDNLYEKVASARARSLGFSMRQTKETIAATVYNLAFDTSYTGGDGKALCVTDHPSAAGSQSNALNPAADISEAVLEDLNIQLMKATDYNGLQIMLKARTLIIPVDLYYEANRIMKSVLTPGTANNAINVLKATNAFPEGIKVNHYLTDTDAFFIRTNCPEGMKCYQRDKFDLKRDNDFDTDNAKAKSYDRYSFGWSDFRQLYGSEGV